MLQVLEQAGNLDEVLRLRPDGPDGRLASIPESLSNAPQVMEPGRGAPFGGLMAALCLKSARELLEVRPALRTLTVQFLAGAKFDDVRFTAESLRGGRSTHFAEVRGGQPGRLAVVSGLTFGREGPGPELRPHESLRPARALADIESTALNETFAPWFTRWVEYRFAEDFKGFGNHDEPVVKVWLRLRDGRPLDELRLAFLLDAVFPNYFMVKGLTISTTVDMRYDFYDPIPPELSPEGWAYFEFRSNDVAGGWAVEDGIALAPDGKPIAAARQLRKMISR